MEGDNRDVCYRGRLGSAYQADICSEAEVGGEAEDRSTRVAVADLWKEMHDNDVVNLHSRVGCEVANLRCV